MSKVSWIRGNENSSQHPCQTAVVHRKMPQCVNPVSTATRSPTKGTNTRENTKLEKLQVLHPFMWHISTIAMIFPTTQYSCSSDTALPCTVSQPPRGKKYA